jgi:hypothetical protein
VYELVYEPGYVGADRTDVVFGAREDIASDSEDRDASVPQSKRTLNFK